MLMLTVEVMRVPGAPDEAILLRVTQDLDKEGKKEKPSYQSQTRQEWHGVWGTKDG